LKISKNKKLKKNKVTNERKTEYPKMNERAIKRDKF